MTRKENVKRAKILSIEATAGLWSKTKESGVAYENRIRAGWQKRLKREKFINRC